MAIFSFDDRHWPLCVTSAQGTLTLDQHLEMLAVWDRWLRRKEPFIVFRRYLDPAAIAQAHGVAQVTKNWLANGAAEEIKLYVRAMCILVPAQTQAVKSKPSVDAVFGVPGGIFDNTTSCISWLDDNQWFECDFAATETFLATFV